MKRNYVIALKFSECDSRKVDRFFAIMASFYTWSLRLFDNTMVIQTEDTPELIESALNECVSRIEKEEESDPSLFEDPEAGNGRFPYAIGGFVICELVNRVIYLKDNEKAKLLEEMLNA